MAQAEATLKRSFFTRRWRAATPSYRRRNNLSPAVGLLELSNALDFAANVWNEIPPPPIAMVFMALGATGALVILFFALFDFPRAWHNIVLLRQERRQLRALESKVPLKVVSPDELSQRSIQVHMDMNSRELGNETIDRFAMGLLLGFGGLTVGLGTYLAMDGANPAVYLASNIITGYVGNVPAAIYGLLNALWCFYGWRRAHRHANVAIKHFKEQTINEQKAEMCEEIKRHSRRVKTHAVINGISGIAGGAGSLMTASAYIKPIGVWGYVILLPCAISAFGIAIYWRQSVNYDRDIVDITPVDDDKLTNDAIYCVRIERLLYALHDDLSPVKSFFRRTKMSMNQDVLRKFLIDYQTATIDWLRHESTRLVEQVKMHENKSEVAEKGKAHISDSDGSITLAPVRGHIAQLEESRSRLVSSSAVSEKMLDQRQLVPVLCQALISCWAFDAFCERIQNSRQLSPLISDSCSSQTSATKTLCFVNATTLIQRATDQLPASSVDLLLTVGCKTLVTEGLGHAKSQVRYYTELSGCAYSQPVH